jgi:hypothetical protein
MRNTLLLTSIATAALALAAWACSNSSDNPNAVISDDGGGEGAAVEAGPDSSLTDDGGGLPDATSNPCTLSDHVTDPVAICIQQQVIGFELQYAYATDAGVAPTWSSTSPYAAGSGAHQWQDDLALAGALGAYYCSSEVYGNNAATAEFDQKLRDLAPFLIGELQGAPPTGPDGETYFRLRWAQAAYNYVNDNDATIVQAIAETFARGLAGLAYPVPASGGTGGDAGSAEAGGEAGGGDAGAGDAGAGNPGGMVIGTKNSDGTVAYSPRQAIMAAAALLDMAVVHKKDADAGSSPGQWVVLAQQTLDYVIARGRDPGTGLFFQSLVTSGDPGHDALGPGSPTGDTFLTEDQAWAMLGLARAQDLLVAYFTGLAPDAGLDASGVVLQTYSMAGVTLAGSIADAGLFDGVTNPSSPPPVGAFYEGTGPGGVLTNKTTVGNAIMLGAFHRIAVSAGSKLGYELGQTRSALLQFSPVHSSLFSVVGDQNGNPVQQAYLRAASKKYDYAVSYADGGLEPGAADYRSDAVNAFIEGISQLWHGTASNASCAP